MLTWNFYKKIGTQKMRSYVPGEDLTGVSVSEADTPEEGGMIARGADDGALWYISKRFLELNYRPDGECDCDGAKFVDHIKSHLLVGQDVICKICGKTPTEIANDAGLSPPCGEGDINGWAESTRAD